MHRIDALFMFMLFEISNVKSDVCIAHTHTQTHTFAHHNMGECVFWYHCIQSHIVCYSENLVLGNSFECFERLATCKFSFAFTFWLFISASWRNSIPWVVHYRWNNFVYLFLPLPMIAYFVNCVNMHNTDYAHESSSFLGYVNLFDYTPAANGCWEIYLQCNAMEGKRMRKRQRIMKWVKEKEKVEGRKRKWEKKNCQIDWME